MKTKQRNLVLLFFTLILAGLGLGLWFSLVSANSGIITGTVVNSQGALAGARVRVRATENMTLTNDTGNFTLTGLVAGKGVEIAAWADGYYVASEIVTPTVEGISVTLRKYHNHDHKDYEWLPPSPASDNKACVKCHPMIVTQWENNAHGGAISNTRFFNLYVGTNLSGTVQVEPGYLTDFPGTAGNCANCHAPGAGLDGFLTTDMESQRGLITAGIHCDYCHKVGGVYLDSASGSVYPNAPGVQSQKILRPPVGDNIFFGPYDDIPDPDTYLPLTHQSQFCAPCHQFSFWGTPIYESYNEWLASPYADQGITCQDCHMPPTGDEFFALPEVGGLPHPPDQIPSHLQPGAADEILLQNTVSMTLDVQQDGRQVWVTVTITNTDAGHHVPTDHPGRHLILTVSATDSDGALLPQAAGETIPDWGGAAAGNPGKIFAKVLRDSSTGAYPVVSYWKQTFIHSDNRIPALESDTSTYAFAIPTKGSAVTVKAELLFRRMFQPEVDARDWPASDFLMEEIRQTYHLESRQYIFIPVIKR